MAKLLISVLALPEHEAHYTEFLQSHPAATIYHSLHYRDLIKGMINAECIYAMAWRDNKIVGVLPTMAIVGVYGRIINSLPFFGSHGGILANDADAADALMGWFDQETRTAVSATVIENPFSEEPWSCLPSRNFTDERIAQWTPLTVDVDFPVRFQAMIDGTARRNIRKAEAAGIVISVDNKALDFLADCHQANMVEIGGLTKPQGFFDALSSSFQPGHDYQIHVAAYKGEPIAALLVFFYKHFAEYIMPVTSPGFRAMQPTAAILFSAICAAQARGCTIWNWGGTWLSQTGVYRFKKKWAAEEKRYRYAIRIANDSLLDRSATELAQAYPFFYVAPYDRLRCNSPGSAVGNSTIIGQQ